MSIRFIKLLPVVALAVSALAHAATPEAQSLVVRYGDLALNTKAGIASLHARIRHAAETVCSPIESRVLGLREQYQQCVRDATAQSVAAVNNPNLSRFHRFGPGAVVVAAN